MKTQKIALLLVLLILLTSAAAYLCCFTVNELEYVILTRFGKTSKIIDEPNLYFKLPGFMETVNRLDKRTHIIKTHPTQLMTSESQSIILTCLICWKISDPEFFFQTEKDIAIANKDLSEMISSQVGNVISSYGQNNIRNIDPKQVKLDEIEQTVAGMSRKMAKEKYGIDIVKVGIRRLAYPGNVESSVYGRMRAEREKEAKKFRAEGRKEAEEIRGTTDKEVQSIMALAYRDAEMKKGMADKEAMKIYGDAYNKDKEFYEFLKSLEIYKQTIQENTTLILSTESAVFKHLNYQSNLLSSDGGTEKKQEK